MGSLPWDVVINFPSGLLSAPHKRGNLIVIRGGVVSPLASLMLGLTVWNIPIRTFWWLALFHNSKAQQLFVEGGGALQRFNTFSDLVTSFFSLQVRKGVRQQKPETIDAIYYFP